MHRRASGRGHNGDVVAVPASLRTEVDDLARAAAGGLLFGVPLLYTMELWWAGESATPAQSLLVLAVAYVVVVLLQRTSGFRRTRDVRMIDAAIDAVDVIAVSLVVVTIVLVLLREITSTTPPELALGKIAHQTLSFGIGAAVARHYLTGSRDEPDDQGEGDGEGDDGSSRGINATFADMGATAIGAVFVALNIAPTDEVPMIHSAVSPGWVIALLGASIVASYLIVFVAGFSGEEQRRDQVGVLQHPITETMVCYLVSLVAAALMLAIFGRLGGPWTDALERAVVLALPAAVGGAAGRLAV